MEEENRSFNWSGLLIKIILVVVFILFTIWLLSLSNNRLSDSVDVLTDKIFSENLERMKKVGKEYFTNDKLPSKIGEFKVITLKEMYEKKLITEIKDKNGDACSEENSYISVEKFEDEYQMKVNLECGKDKDYVIVTITCTEAGTCTLTDDSKTEYQYQKVSNGTWGKWSDWSKWSKDIISKLDNRDVETKIEKETKNYIVTDTKIDTKKLECDINSNYIGQNGLDCKYLETETTNLTCPTGYTQVGNAVPPLFAEQIGIALMEVLNG